MLVKALESDRTLLLEDIGLWIPSEVVNMEHDDKPEGEVDELGISSVSFLSPAPFAYLYRSIGHDKYLPILRHLFFCLSETYSSIDVYNRFLPSR